MPRPLGFSFLYFTPRVEARDLRWFERARHHGYDGVELPINDASTPDITMLREAADAAGLRTTAVGFCTEETNPVADDPEVRRAAITHLTTLVERTAELGAEVLAGPLHSAYGAWTEEPPTDDEFVRCVDVLRTVGSAAERCGIRVAIEPLNRFECYFLNTAGGCSKLVRAVDHPNVVGALDTHHAHIEERDMPAAIRASATSLGHVQLSENHRGTPGSGQVDFAAVLAALDEIDYRGWLVVEAFSRQSPAFGSMLRVWRELDEGPEAVLAAGANVLSQA